MLLWTPVAGTSAREAAVHPGPEFFRARMTGPRGRRVREVAGNYQFIARYVEGP